MGARVPRLATEHRPDLGARGRHQGDCQVFNQVEWEQRSAEIKNPETNETVFRADDLEFPTTWSHNCTALVAEKYFRYVEYEFTNGVTEIRKKRETSVRQMISRVADTISPWGLELGYFAEDVEAVKVFRDELAAILLHQRAAFNSPVWFNVGTKRGIHRTEQISACFLLSVEDNMESILELAQIEGMIYKGGSGSGVNYSNLRSSREKLSGGGTSSGAVSFVKKDDSSAGAIKSGGGTRRAAKIAILNVDHGDIREFISCKVDAEKAAHALIDAGFDGDFRARHGAYSMVPFQNANHSVRVTDAFMEAVENDEGWALMARDGTTELEKVPARTLWKEICESAHFCGDPGLMFHDTANKWHTCPAHGCIRGCNPCAEIQFLDDISCNLASINLTKFQHENGSLDLKTFNQCVDVLITAQEILVDGGSYPTKKIEENSSKFRPLGLGYTNLGAFFMNQGIPYDSDEARGTASHITSLMTARAYLQSSKLAEVKGPFEGYEANRKDMLGVIGMHQQQARLRAPFREVSDAWQECVDHGRKHGFRNAQVTAAAPCGTISFLMDADTTGVEPELSLVKTKKLVGGGSIQVVNQRVEQALFSLGYNEFDIQNIADYVLEKGSVAGSELRKEHYPVFDSSFPEPVSGRFLRPEAHILMVAAVQPFLSGAVSKTCNIPQDSTSEDISRLYQLAWKQGLKSVALYRDGCKRTQPLQSSFTEAESEKTVEQRGVRHKLPQDCESVRHKFAIGPHEGYIHVGKYPDGTIGEIFIKMAKEGSTVSGLMDSWGIMTSLALQYGMPVEKVIERFQHTCFEPSGWTDVAGVGHATSILDYVARWLEHKFIKPAITVTKETTVTTTIHVPTLDSGMTCPDCGHTTQRAGSCSTCPTCGWTSGCG